MKASYLREVQNSSERRLRLAPTGDKTELASIGAEEMMTINKETANFVSVNRGVLHAQVNVVHHGFHYSYKKGKTGVSVGPHNIKSNEYSKDDNESGFISFLTKKRRR